MPLRIGMAQILSIILAAIFLFEWTAVEGRAGKRKRMKEVPRVGRREFPDSGKFPGYFSVLKTPADSKGAGKMAKGRRRAASNAIQVENGNHQLSSRQPQITTCAGEVLTNYIWHFDMAERTAVWEGWASTICDANATVGDVVALSNVQSEDGALVTAEQSSILSTPLPGLPATLTRWSTKRIRSPISVVFDLRYYPFDQIWVPVTMMALQDTTTFNLSYLSFYPHLHGISPEFYTDQGLRLTAQSPYIITELVSLGAEGTFSPTSGLSYARVTLWFCFVRDDYTNFVQLLLPTYLAFLISIASLFLPVSESFDARMGILGASIFVVVLNINALSNFLGTPATMTLGDFVNIATLILITLIFVESIGEKWPLLHYRKAVRKGMETLKEGGKGWSRAVRDAEAAVRMVPEAEQEPNEVVLASGGISSALSRRGIPQDPDINPSEKETSAEDSTDPSKSRRRRLCPTISAFHTSGHPLDEFEYADRVMNLSLAMTIFSILAYAAINVGLLVGWRPESAPPGDYEY